MAAITRIVHQARCSLCSPLANQQGMALILSILLLAVMSILGMTVLNSTNTELSITGNQRSGSEAFMAADRAVQYAMVSGNIYSAIGTGQVDLTDGDPNNATTHETAISAGSANSGLKDGELNRVSFLGSGPLPPDSGSDPTYFQSRYYSITVVAEGPNNSEARVDAQIGRIVPK